ncbi:MAG: 50S ribosomal protein L25/general stress protein Ctc [Sphingomonadales bacterium]|nr:50S ribosomal protein L25/general stress protein Ctc [Sphingomonadales bacterium]
MSDQLTLSAELRERAGKGASRALRREGRVPAVIYGDKKEPIAIHVEAKELVKLLMTGSFTNSTVELTVGKDKQIVLPKDVAFHPVTDRPVHVDFFRIAKGAKLDVEIPVHFINEEKSPGLKRGGVLNIVRHELELICDATMIPEHIEIDVTGYDVGDSIHISAVTLPAGSESAITDRDFTIATIVAPSSLKSGEGDNSKSNDAAETAKESGENSGE